MAVFSIALSFAGILSYSPQSLSSSFIILLIVCYITNYLFSKVFRVSVNSESYFITSLILFLILFPVGSLSQLWVSIIVATIAMASKYLLAINQKHIFNPTAIAIFIIGFFGYGSAIWWIGSSYMIVPVVILGFLVIRKVRRFALFSSFLLAGVASISVFSLYHGFNLVEVLKQTFLSGPILFFGSIMLTEPLTTPPSVGLQVAYGVLVGIFFGAEFQFGPLYSSPALALLIGNLFSYIVSPRAHLTLTLLRKNKLSHDVYDFEWKISGHKTDRKIGFMAGQYMEWTLAHKHPDIRGNRRFFTLASSPTEENLHLGIKFYKDSSSFKKALNSMALGSKIVASQIAGSFTLPKDSSKKMVFIAGGIGITPFRSIIKYLLDKKEDREAVLFFSNKTTEDIVYKDIFDEAENKLGIKTIYVINDMQGGVETSKIKAGIVTKEMIVAEATDYKDRIFYISGSHAMVESFKNVLHKMGVKRSQIKTDFFPGFM